MLGVLGRVVKVCRTAMLISDIDISRLKVYAQQIEEQKLKRKERENKRARIGSYNFAPHGSQGGNHFQLCQKCLAPVHSSTSTPGSNTQGNESRVFNHPFCKECGKYHKRVCRAINNACFRYGEVGHKVQYCPKLDPQSQHGRPSAQSSHSK